MADHAAGVRVIADPEGWRGSVTVEERLVPVELIIENQSGRTLHFSRADVALVGSRYSVNPLAPEAIQRMVPLRTTTGRPPDAIDEGGDSLASWSRAEHEETRPLTVPLRGAEGGAVVTLRLPFRVER